MNEKDFYQRSEDMIMGILKEQPVNATYMGIHKWDHLLGNFNNEAHADFHDKLKNYLQETESINTDNFSKKAEIDCIILKQLLKTFLQEIEKERLHFRSPGNYLGTVFEGVMSLIIKDFAPLEERLESLLKRMRRIPEVLAEGRNNLYVKEVPPVWVEISLQQAAVAPGLFKKIIPGFAENVPALKDELLEAAEKAAEAVEKFGEFLEKDLKPKAAGNFAVGEKRFNEILKENHMVDYDAEELLEIGWNIFKETKKEMAVLAEKINPELSVEEILEEAKKDHPSAENLITRYNEVMNQTKEFVQKKDIVTIPENEKLTIIETPIYLQPIIPFAAYMQPGIFEDELEGLFLVTPVSSEVSEKEKEAKLKFHSNSKIPVTTLHEGYPGHHLQLVWAVTCGSMIRKMGMVLSTLFVEGWAFYCEELMEKLGYISSSIQKLSRLNDQLWRAGRIILDVSLHCRGMSVKEGVNFLVEKCNLEPKDALAEVRRYTTSPTQPQSYLMGKREIMRIIEDYKQVNPDKDMKEIHDTIMEQGSLPPRLLRRQLFE